ncbi:MAG: alanine racemase [Candidatus Krumholzibacteria bacterium]|nr:alanine racemase [Candidatus Krumholzibacteria bacterium]
MNRFPAWVEIDLDAAKHNIDCIRKVIPPHVSMLLVVKADAYGHGSVRISKLAVECGVDMLGVATLDEGRELRKAGITLPILILSPVLPQELESVFQNDLAVAASSYEFAEKASEIAISTGALCTLHVEIDTGMGRTGIAQDRSVETITRISRLPGIQLEGLFTHFPASDSEVDFSKEQIRVFGEIVEGLKAAGVTFRYLHCANSAAILNFPSSHLNLIRPGLLVYGHMPSIVLKDRIDVVSVMSFKARLVLVREMPAGASISYGRTYIAPRPIKMGVVPVGYGHGLSHRLSNKGQFLFRGKRANIIGRVTMDMTMLDLSGFEDASVGEEIVIFGRQGEAQISADEIARWDETLNYEVLCRISKRVPRIYIRSGRIESMKTLLGVRESF